MNNKDNYFFLISLLVIAQCMLSMDQSPGSSSSDLYGSGTSSWTFNPFSLAAGAVKSLGATIHNELSDEAALQKLGFPRNDSYAETELAECKTLYVNVIDPQKRQLLHEMLERTLRRTKYATRVFCTLPDRPNFHEVILHCTQHHKNVMSSFLEHCYNAFLREKLELYNRLSEDIKQLDTPQGSQSKLIIATPQDTEAHSLQITVPTIAGATQFLCTITGSLYQTTKNGLFDSEAFKKLGWPLDDLEAQKGLRITLANYEKIEKVTNHQERIDLLSFVLRRTEYLVRAFLALPHRADAFEMARFLMMQHTKAMFPLLLTLFIRFTATQRQAIQIASDTLLKNSAERAMDKIYIEFGTIKDKTAQEIKTLFPSRCIILLKQVHGVSGCIITEQNRFMEAFSQVGDFLVTNLSGIHLGILTADCLPIIFNDAKHNAIGIAHAGWRGSVDNIVKAVFQCMQRNYDTQASDLSIVFGPCIHHCCYTVAQDVIVRVKDHDLVNETIIKRDDNHFFDLLAFNKTLLMSLGVHETSIDSKKSSCTKCNTNYHSHRRDAQQAGRQLSTVWIK